MGPPEDIARVAGLAQIARAEDGPVFPTLWAARVFALTVALNEAGLFAWSEWAEALGAELARDAALASAEPQAYWRAWLAALEALLVEKQLADGAALRDLREAWRRAAEATTYGEPIELAAGQVQRPLT